MKKWNFEKFLISFSEKEWKIEKSSISNFFLNLVNFTHPVANIFLKIFQ